MNLPDELWILIINEDLKSYNSFRNLNKRFNGVKLLHRIFDEYDVAIAVGFTVDISRTSIRWKKNDMYHSFKDLPSRETSNSKYWYKYGRKHRDYDRPAYIGHEKLFEWWIDGDCHRNNDKPAIIYISNNGGSWIWLKWYKRGLQHRDGDKPAYMNISGRFEWYKKGELYRDDDKPAIITKGGTKKWFINGLFGRNNDLPSIEKANGDRIWHKDGRLHRDNDLPAVIKKNGCKEWWNNGKLFRENNKNVKEFSNEFIENWKKETNTDFFDLSLLPKKLPLVGIR